MKLRCPACFRDLPAIRTLLQISRNKVCCSECGRCCEVSHGRFYSGIVGPVVAILAILSYPFILPVGIVERLARLPPELVLGGEIFFGLVIAFVLPLVLSKVGGELN